MQDISIFFQPVSSIDNEALASDSLGKYITIHSPDNFPSLSPKSIAILSVPEYRNCNQNEFSYTSENDFRTALYSLYIGTNWKQPIIDLGTILPGNNINDTYHALSQVIETLIKQEITPIIIGGSNDLIVAQYRGYEQLEQLVNITNIDAQLDIGDTEDPINNEGWLSKILTHKPCNLFNFSNISAQSHYISPTSLQLMDELYFDVVRLGTISQNIPTTEPTLRNSDLVSIDLTAIRASELNSPYYNQPNGLFAHESCKLAHYSGISDKLTSFGIYEYYPTGKDSVTNSLVAQLIWYFIEGYSNRKGDFPIGSKKTYTTFRVTFEEMAEEIVFCKSDKSGRWWMEVPYPASQASKYQRHHLVPCSYEDYQYAMQGEIPDLWWKTYQKLA